MNTIQSLIDRQLGIYCRLSYDSILKRLVVDGSESFYGLQSAGVVASFDQDPPIFACRFAEVAGREHILALANEDGRVAIQDTSTFSSARSLDGFQCHNNAVFDLAWMPGSMKFVTVSGDHTACLWDIGDGAARRELTFASHTRSVKTCAFRPRSPAVFATGARDGHVLVWDVRAAQPALVLRPDDRLASCHASPAPRAPAAHGKRARTDPRAISITGLVFQDELTLLSCGECDGNIKAWDLRKNYNTYKREPLPKHSIPYCGTSTRNGYTNLIVDRARVRLYASCMDSVIYCFNIAAYGAAPERRYVGHENATFYIKTSLSADGAYLVSGSSDKHAYVWSVARAEPVARLAGHRAEVTCAAWCQQGDPKLVTCSDDARHKIWRIGPELPDPDPTCGGRAEAVPPADPAAPARWRGAERTPTSKRRPVPGSGGSGGAKRARPADPSRRTKRCLTDLMNAARDPDLHELESSAKRSKPGPVPPAEEPAPPAGERLIPAGSKRRMSESDPASCVADAAEWSSAPPVGTPPRREEPGGSRGAPARSPRLRLVSLETPTAGLPDFVRSGEAPHLRLMSPLKRRRGRTDWLTQLASGRRGAPAPLHANDKPPAPVLNLSEKLSAPPLPQRPARPASSPRTLLSYFKVASMN